MKKNFPFAPLWLRVRRWAVWRRVLVQILLASALPCAAIAHGQESSSPPVDPAPESQDEERISVNGCVFPIYVTFDTNQAHLDAAARAVLDDVALRLTSNPDSKLLLISSLGPGEGEGVEGQRLENVSAYIAKRDGDIVLNRIIAHAGGRECKLTGSNQGCVELVFITEKDDVDQVVRDWCSGFTAPPSN